MNKVNLISTVAIIATLAMAAIMWNVNQSYDLKLTASYRAHARTLAELDSTNQELIGLSIYANRQHGWIEAQAEIIEGRGR